MTGRGVLKCSAGIPIALCLWFGAGAALRPHYSDFEVVSRADLIVVGRMTAGSLVYVPHTNALGHLEPSWEHRLDLTVTQILKGQLSATSVVVRLQYGLTPLVNGYFSNQFATIEVASDGHPKGEVQIFDTGCSTEPAPPVTGDIRNDHIWLLRRAGSEEAHESSSARSFWACDPEDIQPVSRKERLLRLLSEDHRGRGRQKGGGTNATLLTSP
jgi:hypothetical protein